MRTFKLFFFFLLVSLSGIQILANPGNSEKTEFRKVSNFQGVKVSGGIDLYIKMGTSEEVKIVADDNIIDKIVTEVKDGSLKIYLKQSGWFNWNTGRQSNKAYVTIKELNHIDASAGSDVRSENTLQGEELRVNASSGSDVEIDIIYKNVWVDASSGADVKLSGKTKTLRAEASSGSDIKAQSLESKICKLTASSGADITVNVSDELYANASSGADIKYYGNPALKETNESSAGDITHKK